MWTVDVDVGGTLTDAVFSRGDKVAAVKVDTTPHDLTVCLLDCLNQGASKLGYSSAADFLDEVEVIRWSTTITSNVLAECRGPRIGLLVSRGNEKDLYGSESRSAVFDRILAEQDVIGLNCSINETDVMNAARALLERGVRRICVSLKDAHDHPEAEREVKQIVDKHYPDHFLGSVPILAGSDITTSADDQTRTHSALINSYTHGALAATLFKAEDELRETANFNGSFLISHVNGGVAGVAKTKAIDTIESGPILGIHGSAYLANLYGMGGLIAMDIGGTTAKISIMPDGKLTYRKPSDFFGIPVRLPFPDLHSIALGGGSVIRLLAECHEPEVQLGPESMGAYPGPACYALGGDNATLTDAFVAAGFINPDYFLGGAKPIDHELACRAIEESVAKPLGISAEDSCRLVIDRAFQLVADLIRQAAPGRDVSDHTLFAYGGNGGLFACGVAEKAGLNRVQVFALGPVFSAFGSSISDISHLYERSLGGMTITGDSVNRIRRVIAEMKDEAAKDILGEGARPEDATYSVEIEVSTDGGEPVSIPCPESAFKCVKDMTAMLGNSYHADAQVNLSDLCIELVRVQSKKSIRKPHLVERPLESSDSSHALTGKRPVLWGSRNGGARLYRWESLRPGSQVQGCAILEGDNTTYFVPEGWVLTIDSFGNGKVSRST